MKILIFSRGFLFSLLLSLLAAATSNRHTADLASFLGQIPSTDDPRLAINHKILDYAKVFSLYRTNFLMTEKVPLVGPPSVLLLDKYKQDFQGVYNAAVGGNPWLAGIDVLLLIKYYIYAVSNSRSPIYHVKFGANCPARYNSAQDKYFNCPDLNKAHQDFYRVLFEINKMQRFFSIVVDLSKKLENFNSPATTPEKKTKAYRRALQILIVDCISEQDIFGMNPFQLKEIIIHRFKDHLDGASLFSLIDPVKPIDDYRQSRKVLEEFKEYENFVIFPSLIMSDPALEELRQNAVVFGAKLLAFYPSTELSSTTRGDISIFLRLVLRLLKSNSIFTAWNEIFDRNGSKSQETTTAAILRYANRDLPQVPPITPDKIREWFVKTIVGSEMVDLVVDRLQKTLDSSELWGVGSQKAVIWKLFFLTSEMSKHKGLRYYLDTIRKVDSSELSTTHIILVAAAFCCIVVGVVAIIKSASSM